MKDNRIIYIFHMVIVAPLLIYIWYINNYSKSKISDSLGVLLLIFGIVIFVYHLYRFIVVQNIINSA